MSTTDDGGAVGLIAQLASASASGLAFTTNSLLAGQEDQYRQLAADFISLFEYLDKCAEKGTAPRERVVAAFYFPYESAVRALERERLHPWPGR